MNRYYTLVISFFLLFIMITACADDEIIPSEAPTESFVESVEVLPPIVTVPPATTVPTVPQEPTIPFLGLAGGSYMKCFYSNVHEDYLNYYIHIPENAVEQMPLVVYLHGDGEVNRIQSLLEYGLSPIVEEIYGDNFPFILLEPNTRIESWTKGSIPELLYELINDTLNQYCINPDKVILTGFSRGAIGVWDMISIYGGFFSAAVPVSSPHQKDHIDYIKAAEVPVWTFAGNIGDTERWYHQYLAQNVDIINGCDGFGKFTILNGCNHSQAKYAAFVEETFEWMLAQERGVIPEE